MLQSPTFSQAAVRRAPRPMTPVWVVVAAAGWLSLAWLGVQLWATVPRRAGFDLELLLVAGRRVAAGTSPYEPSMLAGTPPSAVDPFYSYPPPVAQYFALFAPVPSALVLIAWAGVAITGLVATTLLLARIQVGASAWDVRSALRTTVLPVLAVAAFAFPFAIAVLFGNLDAAFPLLYGLMLAAALVGTASDRFAIGTRFAGGAALAVASVAKVHPSSMGLWFLVRGLRERRRGQRPGSWVVLASAAAVGIAILLFSILAGGLSPWSDFATVLRAGSAADVVDLRNISPAAQLGLIAGGSEAVARVAQVVIAVGAVLLTAWAAWTRDDLLEGFALATIASLVVLPVTWYHYPVALLPIAIAAWLRVGSMSARRNVLLYLGLGLGVAIVAVAMPVLIWGAVAMVLLAVRRSAPAVETGRSSAGGATPFPVLQPSRISVPPLPGQRSTSARMPRAVSS